MPEKIAKTLPQLIDQQTRCRPTAVAPSATPLEALPEGPRFGTARDSGDVVRPGSIVKSEQGLAKILTS